MKTTLTAIEKILPYDRNPRNADAAVEAVAESIREFGFRQPIVVDAQHVIIAGHARYFAAIRLGLDKVPVHIARDLTPEQVRAYRLADNKTAELAGWDDDLLAREIMALTETELDLTAFGFEQSFLDGLGEQIEAEISKKAETGTRQLALKFGKITVPMDQAEYDGLVATLTRHEQSTGSRFGFVAQLLERAGETLPTTTPHTDPDVPSELPALGAETSAV
ncbi:MAG: ParB N-terminal domain-containing protein [Pirellulaceae bacterium]